jgi:hypothetical protein
LAIGNRFGAGKVLNQGLPFQAGNWTNPLSPTSQSWHGLSEAGLQVLGTLPMYRRQVKLSLAAVKLAGHQPPL